MRRLIYPKPATAVLLLLLVLSGGSSLSAEVERIEIRERGVVADGAEFGVVGPYEKLAGTVYFSLDPGAPGNARVVDLGAAERGGDGRVHYSADLFVLQPMVHGRGNGTLLMEISNRGGKAQLRFFNRGAAASSDPEARQHFGDGFLMRHGFTVAWLAWQHDVPDRDGLLRLQTVLAGGIEGLVRADHVFLEDSSQFDLADRSHRPYRVADPDDERNVLTVRDRRLDERRVLPRETWRFTADGGAIELEGGFQKGRIYEAVYVARDPAVVGLGFTAMRDFVSHVKGAEDGPIRAERAIAFGISQSGRFLRHFLYDGFNRDLEGKRVFDGVFAHVAGGGRGSFNHRFGQPSRDAHPFSAFFYPTDIYPFADRPARDPETGREEGLLDRLRGTAAQPKIFFTNSGYEYWGRAASLVHTDPEGQRDLPPGQDVRVYHLAGTQHFPGSFPPRPASTRYPENPADSTWILRALLLAMEEWITTGTEPPPSAVPLVTDGTLVAPGSLRFPSLPGVEVAHEPHAAYRMNYGSSFRSEGVVELQPPEVGKPFGILVPQVGADGNELGGVRLPEIEVPLATYTPWNFRAEEIGAGNELADFRGSFFPFPRSAAEAAQAGDPRPPIDALYGSREEYLGRYVEAAMALHERRLLLSEDLPEAIVRAERLWSSTVSEPADP